MTDSAETEIVRLRKSLRELEDRFYQTLLHGAPPGDVLGELRLRALFYESVMQHQPPHEIASRECKIAKAAGRTCCNPKCNGEWGTGCWCCHALSFAVDAELETMKAHLALSATPDSSAATKQAEIVGWLRAQVGKSRKAAGDGAADWLLELIDRIEAGETKRAP
jgi:hypothetical protein